MIGSACKYKNLKMRSVPARVLSTNAMRGRDQDPDSKGLDATPEPKHMKGGSFEKKYRRRGRPAYLRSPDDTPLRDANRDFMLGVITARACRTLIVYLQETNLTVAHWLVAYMQENPLTLTGTWEDISGDNFIRKLLTMPVEAATYNIGREGLYDNAATIGVDPRSIAQRILQIRYEIAKELIQDLQLIPEDNNQLLRETLTMSLENMFSKSTEDLVLKAGASLHPELEDVA
ncbi:hypothetical protein CEUSTIGMA_g4013.t1 [Chlamydomonas eustigma]|uniref:Uncharacterized protein n=1 Tax=Chlamydomonas eustigma TaxID=1157962 RepID=A0A250X0G7_9CHLO|nr:hypothetical protein CEUSTIGMA_g4013.t1 [Chlamydomonas eustigma]|eukprot:GAX76567.1 hypothetical protein CEUSTIGMA_g4013.t1 [Chlamydomonas eustigma]